VGPMRWAWLLAAVVVAGGVTAGLVLRGGPPKLEEGSFAASGDGRWRENRSPSGDEPVRTLLLRYRPGGNASFSLSVRNAGGDPVRLVGASVLGRDFMFSPRRARFEPSPSDAHGVKPGPEVKLPPGYETAVVITGHFTGCASYDAGSETASRTLALSYRDGDATRTIAVPLRNEIRVTAPEKCS
jgi:hypothetical protein